MRFCKFQSAFILPITQLSFLYVRCELVHPSTGLQFSFCLIYALITTGAALTGDTSRRRWGVCFGLILISAAPPLPWSGLFPWSGRLRVVLLGYTVRPCLRSFIPLNVRRFVVIRCGSFLMLVLYRPCFTKSSFKLQFMAICAV